LASNVFAQQETFDAFISEFNREQPHEALDMATPDQAYTPSKRAY
jgi:transposase InsO family protein